MCLCVYVGDVRAGVTLPSKSIKSDEIGQYGLFFSSSSPNVHEIRPKHIKGFVIKIKHDMQQVHGIKTPEQCLWLQRGCAD